MVKKTSILISTKKQNQPPKKYFNIKKKKNKPGRQWKKTNK